MPEVLASAVVPAPVDAVWRTVRDFDGLPSWHPAIAASRLTAGASPAEVGAVRTLDLAEGGTVVEILTGLDDHARALTYAILESPFPVSGYRSTIRVVPLTATGESFVEWSLVFDCDPADAAHLSDLFGRGVFAAGLEGLSSQFARESSGCIAGRH